MTAYHSTLTDLQTSFAGLLPNHMVIRWASRAKLKGQTFTYVAIWIADTQRWYITGAGNWYGTNELTHDQLLEVLSRPSLLTLQQVEEWSSS